MMTANQGLGQDLDGGRSGLGLPHPSNLNTLGPIQGLLTVSITSAAALPRGPNSKHPQYSDGLLPHTGVSVFLFPDRKRSSKYTEQAQIQHAHRAVVASAPTQHAGGPSGDKELTSPQWDGWGSDCEAGSHF